MLGSVRLCLCTGCASESFGNLYCRDGPHTHCASLCVLCCGCGCAKGTGEHQIKRGLLQEGCQIANDALLPTSAAEET